MGMSYRRAWLLIDTMNRCFRAPLVATAAGGPGGGGARVTDLGHDVLARYRAMEAKARRALADDLAAFRNLLLEDDAEVDEADTDPDRGRDDDAAD
jgi:molybdate transport system regulatory protein